MSKDKDNANDGDGSSSGGNKSEMSLRAQKNLIPKLITPVFVRQFLGDKESAVLELWEKMTMELERGRHLRAHGGRLRPIWLFVNPLLYDWIQLLFAIMAF